MLQTSLGDAKALSDRNIFESAENFAPELKIVLTDIFLKEPSGCYGTSTIPIVQSGVTSFVAFIDLTDEYKLKVTVVLSRDNSLSLSTKIANQTEIFVQEETNFFIKDGPITWATVRDEIVAHMFHQSSFMHKLFLGSGQRISRGLKLYSLQTTNSCCELRNGGGESRFC